MRRREPGWGEPPPKGRLKASVWTPSLSFLSVAGTGMPGHSQRNRKGWRVVSTAASVLVYSAQATVHVIEGKILLELGRKSKSPKNQIRELRATDAVED